MKSNMKERVAVRAYYLWQEGFGETDFDRWIVAEEQEEFALFEKRSRASRKGAETKRKASSPSMRLVKAQELLGLRH